MLELITRAIDSELARRVTVSAGRIWIFVFALSVCMTGCSSSNSNKSGDTMPKDNTADLSAQVVEATPEQQNVAGQVWYDESLKLNHLAGESSPYLLSHADNPVDWYPWGDEALERSKAEDKPIFLSIGYAACHWCHVMEHESFEDDSVAAFLNENFIAIKVDREQRPDLDQIYMTAVQAFTRGGGGWPMSVFMTPDLKPFFAGTYFPRDDKYGRPGFLSLANNINRAYRENRSDLNKQADALSQAVIQRLQPLAAQGELERGLFEKGIQQSLGRTDFVNGGFGSGTKFPHAAELSALLRQFRLTGDEKIKKSLDLTLTAMINRGMYDQVGGGFHRYTVDPKWAVPHFEKMLYDNSLLVPLYLDAYLVFKKYDYLDAAVRTLDFMIRELSDPPGGFYSALDADSEHEEGKFYVWKKSDIDAALGEDADFYYKYFHVSEAGNFEHLTNVMARNDAAFAKLENDSDAGNIRARLAQLNQTLFTVRAPRERPLTDDKVVTGWNGMALTALCRGYQVTSEQRFLNAATRLGRFLKNTMFADGKLRHTYRRGGFSSGQFLEDYGYVANGMVDLYESDADYQWLEFATRLARDGFTMFSDASGALYLSPKGESDHIVRPSDVFDGSYPAPGSYLMLAAQRIAALNDDKGLAEHVDRSLRALSGAIKRSPVGMLSAALVLHNQYISRVEFAVVGDGPARADFLDVVYRSYLPYRVIAASDKADDRVALLKGRDVMADSENGATGYVCQNYICQLPASSVDEFAKQVAALNTAP